VNCGSLQGLFDSASRQDNRFKKWASRSLETSLSCFGQFIRPKVVASLPEVVSHKFTLQGRAHYQAGLERRLDSSISLVRRSFLAR